MKEVYLKVAPGGVFFLHVPLGGNDGYYWYSQRVYGAHRLPLLLRGWQYLGLTTSDRMYAPSEEFSLNEVGDKSPVFILQKPASVDGKSLLDVSKFDRMHCDPDRKLCAVNRKP